MRLLLDTHIAVWTVLESRQLPSRAKSLMQDLDVGAAVSILSLWEIALKNSLGRAPRDPIGLSSMDARDAFDKADFAVIPIYPRHLLVLERLEHHHGDPFDRLLVATARSDGYRLLTSDRRLAAYGDTVLVV